ncbi:hypothetical protein M0R45_026518 [Rubus argutus]|uniref:DUF4283 domain-containing protein n=1 Tax=Rubus argutus TaxID=59490 RepID=A0AAW1X189_RUBAR
MFGKSKEVSEQFPEKVAFQNSKEQSSKEVSDDKCNFLKNREVEKVFRTQTVSQQSPEEFQDKWGCAVVCERQLVHQSWKNIEVCLSRWLGREVELVPYQNNRAFFVCKTCEEAEMIAKQKKLPVKGQSDVILFEWVHGLTNNWKKVVSYGGWIAVKGLPLHWWSSKFFKLIGDTCGGFIEVDKRTENFKLLFEARIKVKENGIGFLPESIKLTEGDQSYIIRIQPFSRAIQPVNVRRSEEHLLVLGENSFSEAGAGSFFGVSVDRNGGRRSTICLPASLNVPVGELTQFGAIRGNGLIEDVQKVSDEVLENRLEDTRSSWKNKEQSREGKTLGTEYSIRNNVHMVLNAGGALVLNKSAKNPDEIGSLPLLGPNKKKFGPEFHLARSETLAVGSLPSAEVENRTLPRRRSEGDLFKSKRVTARSTIATPSFFRKFGQGQRLKIKVLKPFDFESRKTQPADVGVSALVDNNPVLWVDDDDIEEESLIKNNLLSEDLQQVSSGTGPKGVSAKEDEEGVSFEEELEKEERDWSSNLFVGEDVIDRYEEGIGLSAQVLDGLLCSEVESEFSEDDLSSIEGDKVVDPLEDKGFSLGDFLLNPADGSGQEVPKETEGKSEALGSSKEKVVGVVEKITQLDNLGEVSCSPQLIKQYKRRKGGSVKGGTSHNQRLSSAFQHVGKLGRTGKR